MDDYRAIWVGSARRCRPTQDWHWTILERDYKLEYDMVRLAFLGLHHGRAPDPNEPRGQCWRKIGHDARLIANAIAEKFAEHGHPLPYVNTLWKVIAEEDFR